MRVLIVEDETRLAANVRKGLTSLAGFAVDAASDGEEGLYLASEGTYDAIVLDLMLPKMNGELLLRRLRERKVSTPVLVLTAVEDKATVVRLLEMGADDYLAKPFDMGELIARVKAVIRRNFGHAVSVLRVDDLELDMNRRQVKRAGAPIELKAMEYRVLEYLMARRDSVISKSDLLEHLYDYNWEKFSNVIEVYISGLRRKIDREEMPKLIHTVRGHGYVIREEAA
ncbi:MAG: response regulator transcription factor [Acidobacteriaceae bacterium]